MASPEELSRLATRYREEDSPALLIEAGLTRMLDSPAHQVLQDDLESMAKPWEVYEASEETVNTLPDLPGLYMFVWRPGPRFSMAASEGIPCDGTFRHILYIGQAGGSPGENKNTLRNRYRDYRKHFKGNPEDLWVKGEPRKRAEKLTHYLQLGPLEFWCAVVEDRAKIENLEKRLIRLYNPPVNNIHTPRLRARLGSSRNAWDN